MPLPKKNIYAFVFFLVIGIMCVLCARQSGAQSAANAANDGRPPVFRVGVENVFIQISVNDSLGRNVTGLKKENFQIFEDKVEQTITHFSNQEAPVSVGIIFDVSGSMKDNDNFRKAKNAITRFLQFMNPED